MCCTTYNNVAYVRKGIVMNENNTDAQLLSNTNTTFERAQSTHNRAVVSVLGKNRCGIVAKVATILANNDADILDISQTIMSSIFTMTMVVDLSEVTVSFAEIQEALDKLGETLHVQITMQREDVFTYMYRL